MTELDGTWFAVRTGSATWGEIVVHDGVARARSLRGDDAVGASITLLPEPGPALVAEVAQGDATLRLVLLPNRGGLTAFIPGSRATVHAWRSTPVPASLHGAWLLEPLDGGRARPLALTADGAVLDEVESRAVRLGTDTEPELLLIPPADSGEEPQRLVLTALTDGTWLVCPAPETLRAYALYRDGSRPALLGELRRSRAEP